MKLFTSWLKDRPRRYRIDATFNAFYGAGPRLYATLWAQLFEGILFAQPAPQSRRQPDWRCTRLPGVPAFSKF